MFEVADQNSDFRELWASFSRSGNQEEYYQGWIELQCARIPHVKGGVLVLRSEEQDAYTPVARWPAAKDILQPLVELAERVIDEDCGLVSDLALADVDVAEGFRPFVARRVPKNDPKEPNLRNGCRDACWEVPKNENNI